MKVWKKARFTKKDKEIDMISRAYLNYVYRDGPINDIIRKYHIQPNDILKLNQYTADRIAGLVLLYLAQDKKRLSDIVLKYKSDQLFVLDIISEIEGYVEK